jgi:MSHA pilin protein MshC
MGCARTADGVRCSARRAAGFTLIELVAVVLILGIVAAAGFPHLFDNRAYSERAYADNVAVALRYAQKVAVSSNCSVRVDINAAGYIAFQQTALLNTCNPAGAWNLPVVWPDGSQLSGQTPTNVVVAPAMQVDFAPSGAVAGNPPQLNVGPFAVLISARTGQISVQ